MFKATSSKYIYRFLNTPVSIFRLFLSRINLRKKGDENKSHLTEKDKIIRAFKMTPAQQ